MEIGEKHMIRSKQQNSNILYNLSDVLATAVDCGWIFSDSTCSCQDMMFGLDSNNSGCFEFLTGGEVLYYKEPATEYFISLGNIGTKKTLDKVISRLRKN